jgi:hypothetical protein
MPRDRRTEIRDPGVLSTRQLGLHWRVSDSTVRQLILIHGIARVPIPGPARWSWRSVWRSENHGQVPRALWGLYRRPLLTSAEAAAALSTTSVRALRARVERGDLQAVRLGPRILRFTPVALEALLGIEPEADPATISPQQRQNHPVKSRWR